jgi:hypothetical protein
MKFDDRPEPAKRLEQARIARGFSDAREATLAFGWNYHTYAQHENGTRGIVRAASRYAKAYGVSEAWLLTGTGPGPKPIPKKHLAPWNQDLAELVNRVSIAHQIDPLTPEQHTVLAEIVWMLIVDARPSLLIHVKALTETLISVNRRIEDSAKP